MKVKLTVGTVTGLKLNTTYVHRRYTWADQLIVKLAVFVSKSYNYKLHKKEMNYLWQKKLIRITARRV